MNLGDFKNFHDNLCNRFDYPHDDAYWWRDQISLIEHIASRLQAAESKFEEIAKQELDLRTIAGVVDLLPQETIDQLHMWKNACVALALCEKASRK